MTGPSSIHSQQAVLGIAETDGLQTAPDQKFQVIQPLEAPECRQVIKSGECLFFETRALEQSSQGVSSVHEVVDGECVLLLPAPEESLDRVMQAEGQEPGKQDDG